MTRLPLARSTPLTLPQVCITSPSATSFRFASQTSFLIFPAWQLFSDAIADLNQALHHAMKIARPLFRSEGIVKLAIE